MYDKIRRRQEDSGSEIRMGARSGAIEGGYVRFERPADGECRKRRGSISTQGAFEGRASVKRGATAKFAMIRVGTMGQNNGQDYTQQKLKQ